MDHNKCIIKYYNNKYDSINLDSEANIIYKSIKDIISPEYDLLTIVTGTITNPIISIGITDYASLNDSDINIANNKMIDILGLATKVTCFMNQLNVIINDIQYSVYCVNIKNCKKTYPTRSIEYIANKNKKILVCVIGKKEDILKYIDEQNFEYIDTKKCIGIASIEF